MQVPLYSGVLNEIGEVDEDFEVPRVCSTEPYILRGYMDSWPAMRSERWQRYQTTTQSMAGRRSHPIRKPASCTVVVELI